MKEWFDKNEKELIIAINMALINQRKISQKKDKLFTFILILNLIVNLINMILLII